MLFLFLPWQSRRCPSCPRPRSGPFSCLRGRVFFVFQKERWSGLSFSLDCLKQTTIDRRLCPHPKSKTPRILLYLFLDSCPLALYESKRLTGRGLRGGHGAAGSARSARRLRREEERQARTTARKRRLRRRRGRGGESGGGPNGRGPRGDREGRGRSAERAGAARGRQSGHMKRRAESGDWGAEEKEKLGNQ